jgi:hypothetical protein
VRDPDGNEWEVYVLTNDLLDDHAHDHAGNPLAIGIDLSERFHPVAPANPSEQCCQ